MDSNSHIFLKGCARLEAHSWLEAELLALQLALKCAKDWRVTVYIIFTDLVAAPQVLDHIHDDVMWRQHYIHSLSKLKVEIRCTKVEIIARNWNQFTDSLARQGTFTPVISLVHSGLDLSKWLMKLVRDLGLSF